MPEITVHGVHNVHLVTKYKAGHAATLDDAKFSCPPYSIVKMYVEARDGEVLVLNLFLDDRATSAVGDLQAVFCPDGTAPVYEVTP
jgi:hypothetical protein